jgi:hypothetical protein
MQDLQNMRDRIDNQMRQIQQQQNQIPQQVPTNLTQNFQITPQQNIANELEVKYANNIDEVKNTFVMKTGVFLTKDFSTLWIKDVSGNVRTFRTEEVVELDEKDKEIMYLKKQIEEMKGMINYGNESNVNNSDYDESNESKNAKKLPSRAKPNAK